MTQLEAKNVEQACGLLCERKNLDIWSVCVCVCGERIGGECVKLDIWPDCKKSFIPLFIGCDVPVSSTFQSFFVCFLQAA